MKKISLDCGKKVFCENGFEVTAPLCKNKFEELPGFRKALILHLFSKYRLG